MTVESGAGGNRRAPESVPALAATFTPIPRMTAVKRPRAIPHNPADSVPNAFRTSIRKTSPEKRNAANPLD